MRAELLRRVQAVPAGQAVALPALAASLNIPPRHVAYILSQLSADEQEIVPRHRVVPKDMRFPKKRTLAQELQIARLAQDGLHPGSDGALTAPPEGWMVLPQDQADRFWADDP